MEEVILDWKSKGKERKYPIKDYSTEYIYEVEGCDGEWRNVLFHGNLQSVILSNIKDFQGRFQMIYADPPFFTRRRFTIGNKKETAYDDRWPGGRGEYLNLLYDAFSLFHRLLGPSGLLFVHIDYRSSAYVKLLLDEIFGEKNFCNEIIWNYQSGGRATKHFSRKHDNIYMYSKTRSYAFYPKAVGIPRGSQRRNHMKKSIDKDGRVFFSIKSAGKEYRYYEDDKIVPSDVWTDISFLHQKHPERTGYSTQKPEGLLQRIILSSTGEEDLVGDFFCGSGTTLVTAAKLNRRWIGCDCSHLAIKTCQERLLGLEHNRTYEIRREEQ